MSQARSKLSRGEQLLGQRRDPGRAPRPASRAGRAGRAPAGARRSPSPPGRGRSGARSSRPAPAGTRPPGHHDAVGEAPAADEDALGASRRAALVRIDREGAQARRREPLPDGRRRVERGRVARPLLGRRPLERIEDPVVAELDPAVERVEGAGGEVDGRGLELDPAPARRSARARFGSRPSAEQPLEHARRSPRRTAARRSSAAVRRDPPRLVDQRPSPARRPRRSRAARDRRPGRRAANALELGAAASRRADARARGSVPRSAPAARRRRCGRGCGPPASRTATSSRWLRSVAQRIAAAPRSVSSSSSARSASSDAERTRADRASPSAAARGRPGAARGRRRRRPPTLERPPRVAAVAELQLEVEPAAAGIGPRARRRAESGG